MLQHLVYQIALGFLNDIAKNTLTVAYNDLEAVQQYLKNSVKILQLVIVEPVAGNMGVVPPLPGFLEGLRELTEKHGTVLNL